ncbi:MAG: hypothetical protein NT172_16180 [Planctomycetota bacterium]|nr:hypothetical protein [Planctomycetota bacterium]
MRGASGKIATKLYSQGRTVRPAKQGDLSEADDGPMAQAGGKAGLAKAAQPLSGQ